ncbi:MAG: PQ-loop repeat-containing protein [Patescibacteria group bacterium]
MFIQLTGWIGAFLLATCGLPQAWKTFRTKKCGDLSWGFLMFWFWGEIFTLAYIISDNFQIGSPQPPLYFNYGLNISILFYLIYTKFRYRAQNANHPDPIKKEA